MMCGFPFAFADPGGLTAMLDRIQINERMKLRTGLKNVSCMRSAKIKITQKAMMTKVMALPTTLNAFMSVTFMASPARGRFVDARRSPALLATDREAEAEDYSYSASPSEIGYA